MNASTSGLNTAPSPGARRSGTQAGPAWLDAQVSLFNSARAVVPCETLGVAELLERIRKGYWGDVDLLRQRRKKYPEQYVKAKVTLPAFTLSARVKTRAANVSAEKRIISLTGLLQGDLDANDNPLLQTDINTLKERLACDPHTAFVFLSPSGVGLKTGIVIDPTRQTESFTAAAAYYQDKYNLVLDPSTKDVLRLCFVSYDPSLKINPDAVRLHLSTQPPKGRNENTVHTVSITSSGRHVDGDDYVNGPKDKGHHAEICVARARLYQRLVVDTFPPAQNRRNEALCAMVPFLHRNLAREVAQAFAARYLKDGPFRETVGRHIASFNSLWNGCERAYPQTLASPERTVYTNLSSERHRIVFRVARKLGEDGEFFMTCAGLAARLGDTSSKTPAHRLLEEFWKERRIIERIKKGYRKRGGKSRGTTWRYLLHDTQASVILNPPTKK